MGKNSNNTEAFHIINNFHINIENTYNNVNSIEKSDEVTEENYILLVITLFFIS